MMNIAVDSSTLTFPVDQEHAALRFTVIVMFIALWVVGFSISNSLIPSAGFNIIAGLIGIVAAAIGARLLEPFLKARWPSGRVVRINHDGIRLSLRDKIQEEVKSGEAVSVLLWRFKVMRRGRVPKGWYVIACALEQDDRYLPIYSFASPDQCEGLNKKMHFTELLGDKALKNVKQDSLRVSGEQRRLRLAEAHRWNNGAEMTYADFERFLERLNGLFPQWIP
jgi:hypothetical protein